MISSLDAKEIASRGGGMIISSSSFSTLDLKEIASRAANGGGTITIRNAQALSSLDVKEIALRGNGKVVFDYTS